MNCESIEHKILLAQSGELSGIGRWRLARHTRACPRCRQYQADLDRLTTVARSAGGDADVNGAVIERIRAAARRESSHSVEFRLRPNREPFGLMWRPALLYGALSILLLTGFWLAIRPSLRPQETRVAMVVPTPAPAPATQPAVAADWDDGVDSRIDEIGNLLAMASGEDGYADSSGAESETEDVNTIAEELLALEGEHI